MKGGAHDGSEECNTQWGEAGGGHTTTALPVLDTYETTARRREDAKAPRHDAAGAGLELWTRWASKVQEVIRSLRALHTRIRSSRKLRRRVCAPWS